MYSMKYSCNNISMTSIDLFLDSDSFIITYHISLGSVQDNYCNNNLLILDVKQLNKIMKLYYLKALRDGQDKINMYYGMSMVKNQLSEKVYYNLFYNLLYWNRLHFKRNYLKLYHHSWSLLIKSYHFWKRMTFFLCSILPKTQKKGKLNPF